MFRTEFVYPFQRMLEYRSDGSVAVLGPGRHRVRRSARYDTVDLRTSRMVLPTQEIPVTDGATVRVSIAVDTRVVDPVAFRGKADAPHTVVYLAVQVGVRDVVASLTIEDVLARRIDLADVREQASVAASTVGLEVTEIAVRDVGVPSDLERARRAAVIAETDAKAELERARAEAAAMRVRANAATLLERHPVLARIRMLEALPDSAKVVIRMDGEEVGGG